MKQILNLMLSFAPWIAFMILAGHSLLSLDIALVVSAVLVIVMGVTGLHKGAIMYASYAFFAAALLFVVGLKNMWFIEHLGVLANGTLLAACMLGMIFGAPFTESYARAEAPQEHWNSGPFVRSCYITTSFWTTIFLLNEASAFVQYYDKEIPDIYFTFFNYSMLFAGVIGTNIYTRVMRSRRAAAAPTTEAA